VILTDREILFSLESGLISIEPQPSKDMVASTSLDLRLGESIRVYKEQTRGMDTVIDPTADGYNVQQLIKDQTEEIKISSEGYPLKRGILVLAWTLESINLRKHGRIAARVEGKSSLARIGLAVHVTAPTIHAGFNANSIQLEIVNHGPLPIKLKSGMPICQLIFEQTLGVPEKLYEGQFNQQGPK